MRNGSGCGWNDRKDGDEIAALHIDWGVDQLAARATSSLLGDDAVADFGYAENDRGAGERAQGTGDPYDGEGHPDAGVMVGLKLGDYGDAACGDDHCFDPFCSDLRPTSLKTSYNEGKHRGRRCVDTVMACERRLANRIGTRSCWI